MESDAAESDDGYMTQSESESDDKSLEKVKDYLNNSYTNGSAGPSFSTGKVPGFEGDYLSDSSIEETFNTPLPAPTYVGKGKQRADPVDEALYDRGHTTSLLNKRQNENPPQQQQENMQIDVPPNQDNSLISSDKIIMDRCLSLIPSKPPNYPNWGADEIMVPCPLSGAQQDLIKNTLTDVNLSYHLSEIPAKGKPKEKSPFLMAIHSYLRIINNGMPEEKNRSLSQFHSSNNQDQKTTFFIGKLRMLGALLQRLRNFPIKIGIAASIGRTMNAVILVMDKCGQKYEILDDNQNKRQENLYDKQNLANEKESFCILFSTAFVNHRPNVMPKLDLIIAYDTSFEPDRHFYFSMHNLQTPTLRLVAVDSMEHVLVYGLVNKVSYLNTFPFEKLLKIFFFGTSRKKVEMTVGVHWRNHEFMGICDKVADCVNSMNWSGLSFGMEDKVKKWIEEIGYKGNEKYWCGSNVPSIYRNFDIDTYELSKEILDLTISPTQKIDGSSNIVPKTKRNPKRQAESDNVIDPKKIRLDVAAEKNTELIETDVSEGLTVLRKELIEVLRAQLDTANQKLASARAEINDLQQKLERENSDELSRLREHVVTLQNQCERELTAGKKEILDKQEEINRLKIECDKLKEDKKNLEEQTTSLNILNGRVVLNAKKSKDEADAKLESNGMEIQSLKLENSRLEQLNSMLNKRMEELNKQVFKLNNQLSVQGETMKKLTDEKVRLAQLTVQQTQEIGRLKSLHNENNRLNRPPPPWHLGQGG